MSAVRRRPDADWVDVTGNDVWGAIGNGIKLSFCTCVIGAILVGSTTTVGAELGFVNCLILFAGCVLFGAFVYLPLKLGVVAADRRSGFVPGLLRFAHGLVVFVGTAAILLLLLARLVVYLLALVFKIAG